MGAHGGDNEPRGGVATRRELQATTEPEHTMWTENQGVAEVPAGSEEGPFNQAEGIYFPLKMTGSH